MMYVGLGVEGSIVTFTVKVIREVISDCSLYFYYCNTLLVTVFKHSEGSEVIKKYLFLKAHSVSMEHGPWGCDR